MAWAILTSRSPPGLTPPPSSNKDLEDCSSISCSTVHYQPWCTSIPDVMDKKVGWVYSCMDDSTLVQIFNSTWHLQTEVCSQRLSNDNLVFWKNVNHLLQVEKCQLSLGLYWSAIPEWSTENDTDPMCRTMVDTGTLAGIVGNNHTIAAPIISRTSQNLYTYKLLKAILLQSFLQLVHNCKIPLHSLRWFMNLRNRILRLKTHSCSLLEGSTFGHHIPLYICLKTFPC